MNILIKGMEKPKSCYNHCLEGFIANEEIGCPLNDYIESHQYKNAIHPDCPLIEIVTCGECKHYVREACRLDPFWERYTEPNDFCSQGERRADAVDDRLLADK